MNWLRIISFLLFTPACGCGGKPAIPVTLDEICRQPKDAVVMVEGYLISSNQTAATSDKETTTQKNYQLLLVSQPNITGTGGGELSSPAQTQTNPIICVIGRQTVIQSKICRLTPTIELRSVQTKL